LKLLSKTPQVNRIYKSNNVETTIILKEFQYTDLDLFKKKISILLSNFKIHAEEIYENKRNDAHAKCDEYLEVFDFIYRHIHFVRTIKIEDLELLENKKNVISFIRCYVCQMFLNYNNVSYINVTLEQLNEMLQNPVNDGKNHYRERLFFIEDKIMLILA